MLQQIDSDEMLKCIIELVKLEKDWVPDSENSSLYIRPTMIGTNVCNSSYVVTLNYTYTCTYTYVQCMYTYVRTYIIYVAAFIYRVQAINYL